MGRLSNISGYKAAKAFEKTGWKKMGQVGSHLVMVNTGINNQCQSIYSTTQGTFSRYTSYFNPKFRFDR
jgi:hypothetical protein